MSYEDRPPLPSLADCPVRGRRGHPSSSAVASFLLWIRFAFLLSLFVAPSSVSEWSPRCHGIRKEQKELCSQRERVSLPVSKPFSWQAISSLRRQPQGPPSIEEAGERGVFLGSACGCQVTALPTHLFAGRLEPFFHPPPQGGSLNRSAWTKSFKDSPASAPRCRGSVAIEHIISSLRMPFSTGSLCPAAESRTT